jgi:Tat protein secretion system quality control protein TatD with DNase activity
LLRDVCACVAQLRDMDADAVARATSANCERTFGLARG